MTSIILIDNDVSDIDEDADEISSSSSNRHSSKLPNTSNDYPIRLNEKSDTLSINKDVYKSSKILQNLIPRQSEFVKLIDQIFNSFHDGPDILEISYDILVENERGLTIFGIPLFSPSALIPSFDPTHYCTVLEEGIQNLKLYPLKNEANWVWIWDHWYVLMLNDTDDKGWSYATRFGSSTWKGCFRFFGATFARRRLWIRLRKRIS